MTLDAGWLARGGVLVLIALLVVGYVRFNITLDNQYAVCRESNDEATCTCWFEGYTAERNIFTEAPVFSWFVGMSDRAFAQYESSLLLRCGVTHWS